MAVYDSFDFDSDDSIAGGPRKRRRLTHLTPDEKLLRRLVSYVFTVTLVISFKQWSFIHCNVFANCELVPRLPNMVHGAEVKSFPVSDDIFFENDV